MILSYLPFLNSLLAYHEFEPRASNNRFRALGNWLYQSQVPLVKVTDGTGIASSISMNGEREKLNLNPPPGKMS